ncbi:hypothetical protein SPSIL_023850 [Sporomusa silvacetica DSM 10669]|uniref:Uncharacterized protein n=1 Tax=Sporomusa silvacetica DSM 10669 TaxID=1123289 RepID=A0ABZ3IKL5_9FIRM|nr:hypothetical protein SPSIL_53820 [Sporomusa silvacetica DSM 10669]
MKVYEVLYRIMLITGDTKLTRVTLEAVSPEKARAGAYNHIFKVKPTQSKIKFMYVRQLKNSDKYSINEI